jgi:hypothetical protein
LSREQAFRENESPEQKSPGAINTTRAGEALSVLNLKLDWSDFLYDLIQANNVHGLRALGRILHRQLHSLTLIQVPVTFTLNNRVMDKDILFLSIRADKPIPLHTTEPLNSP